jgi:hypothetical protein
VLPEKRDGGGTRGNGKTKCIELNMPFFKAFKHILATEGVGGVYQSAAGISVNGGSNQGEGSWFSEYKRIVTNIGEKP